METKANNFFGQAITTFLVASLLTGFFTQASAQHQSRIVINADLGKQEISRHIYGHFSEHLGRCIYGGYWVGEGSGIPNTRGIRNDVVEALKRTNIPNLRWPGGCFADEYHWMDGIGPRDQRPTMINTHWGGVTEDNAFGTHEFLDLCEQLETEPVIVGNVGSGTVEELSKWVEYVNFDGVSPMADLRRSNGREEPWGVVYWGIGNENWGCGGHMTPEHYANLYRNYATYARNYGATRLRKIAGGANASDFNWTEVLMRNIPHWMMWGLSLHHYTTDWSNKGPATGFSEYKYFDYINRVYNIERVIRRHMAIMDRHDPEKRVALVVDEWGSWYDVEPGTNPGFLYQQNTMRDAFIAGISLNYFNEMSDRVRMANIAQTVNVLQALILTDEEKMLLTPTYHVFEMYKGHHDAILLPLHLETANYVFEGREVPALSASASKKDGHILLSIVNVDPRQDSEMVIDFRGQDVSRFTGRILTAPELDAHNTFDKPENVKPTAFNQGRLRNNELRVTIPAKSVVVFEIN
jgi:alpha-L-arabinofuranosidase